MGNLVDDLQAIAGHAHVLGAPEDLLVYESDGTVHHGLPAAVVLPATAEEVAACVRVAQRHQVPVMARGAGTGLSGGAVPVNGGVLIGTARMNRLLHLDIEDRYAVVQPGMVNADLSLAVAPHGLYYAPDPSSQKACTIGGNVAENSGGPHCLLYGMTSNHILGLEVVLGSGERFRVGGPVADLPGYDLTGVLVGSEGTLVICTEITVQLLLKPQATRTLLAIFGSLEPASSAVAAVIAAGMVPSALEMMDAVTIRAVEAAMHAGYPPDAGAVLLIELDGADAEVEEQAALVKNICRQAGATEVRVATDESNRQRLWAGRKGALGALGVLAPNYFIQDGVVPRTRLTEVVRLVEEIGREYELTIANVFHAGDGNLHPCIVFDARTPGALERVQEAGARILRFCIDVGGSITGEHGVGVDKQDYLGWMFSPSDLRAMQVLKDAFDPDHRLNPGKIFPGAKGCGEIQGVNPARALAGMV